MMRESLGHLGDEAAVSVGRTGDGHLLLVSATKVKDVPGFEQLLESLPAQMEQLRSAQQAFGVTTAVKFTPKAVSYNGVDISEWDFTYDFKAAPGPFGQQMATLQKGMVTAIWGDPVKAYSAFKDNTFLFAQGGGALESLKGILDGRSPALAGSEGLAAALAGMPPKPFAVGYMSLQDFAGWVFGLIQGMMPPTGRQAALPKVQFEDAPPLGFEARLAEGGALDMHFRIPVQAVHSAVAGFESLRAPAGPAMKRP
jgi:hypothetical protein